LHISVNYSVDKIRYLAVAFLGVIFSRTMDVESFVDAVSERVVGYVRDDKTRPLVDYVPPAKLEQASDLEFSEEGGGLEQVLLDIDEYLRRCVKTDRPEFMNPLWAGVSLAGLAAEMIANVANTSMYTYEIAPLATLIELKCLERLADQIGFTTFGTGGAGTFTTGGSNGNMLGMLCARQHAFPNSTENGIDGRALVAFVSSEAHYSVCMSGNVLGIGHRNVVKVAVDCRGRMLPEALAAAAQAARDAGKTPFCVVSTAGTTVRGAFDPIDEITAVARREGMWHHVDAAWGAPAMFSETHRGLLRGIGSADSASIDAHKMMGLQLVCSALLVNKDHRKVLAAVCSHGDGAHYLYHAETEDVDLGRYSLQCGRRNDALKLWLAWREVGTCGWGRMVDGYCELAAYLEQAVLAHPELELMSARQWTNVCLRYRPLGMARDRDAAACSTSCSTMSGVADAESGDDTQTTRAVLNKLNGELRERLMRMGHFMISKAVIGADAVLRPVVSNPRVTRKTLDELLSEIVSIGRGLSAAAPALRCHSDYSLESN
jgi:glutamate/tyrosine decarboxylase-like PLP-dependent enzyme